MSRSGFSPPENIVRDALGNNFGNVNDLKVVLGVSAGVDSVTLLHILNKLHVNKVVVAHVNYKTRGDASNNDQVLVKKLADRLGYPFELKIAPVESNESENFQSWARDIRYHWFNMLKKRYKADTILTAHHRDDQIETILMKLLRGAGLESWSGMSVYESGLCRPLLNVSKQTILEYAQKNKLQYREDISNKSVKYARNLIRINLKKQLDLKIPGWEKNILKLPGKAILFSQAVEALYKRVFESMKSVNFSAFIKLNENLQRALFLHALKKLEVDVDISKGALNQLNGISELQTGQKLELAENLLVLRDRSLLKIITGSEPDDEVNHLIQKWHFKDDQSVQKGSISLKRGYYVNPDFDNALYLNEDKLVYPLTLRNWISGDLFRPFGMEGHQKVSDHITNRKISSAERSRVKVVETFDNTICAVIFPEKLSGIKQPGTIAEDYRCQKENERCLIIHRN